MWHWMTRLCPGVCARPSVAVACTSIFCEARRREGRRGVGRGEQGCSAGSLGGMLEWSLRSGDFISQQR